MRRVVADVLETWRRADRLANTLPENDPDQARAAQAAEALRRLYAELTRDDPLPEEDARQLLEEVAPAEG